jgi:hypothetical protein
VNQPVAQTKQQKIETASYNMCRPTDYYEHPAGRSTLETPPRKSKEIDHMITNLSDLKLVKDDPSPSSIGSTISDTDSEATSFILGESKNECQTVGRQQSKGIEKHVTFGNLQFRKYFMIVGDHPDCSEGCPVSRFYTVLIRRYTDDVLFSLIQCRGCFIFVITFIYYRSL